MKIKKTLLRVSLVLVAGLEPARVSPVDFESTTSANFITPASKYILTIIFKKVKPFYKIFQKKKEDLHTV